MEIRILAEVEKVWIIIDGDQNGTLDLYQVKEYIKLLSQSVPALTEKKIEMVFKAIDEDRNGTIDKDESFIFLKVITMMNEHLEFKSSQVYIKNFAKIIEKRKDSSNPSKIKT